VVVPSSFSFLLVVWEAHYDRLGRTVPTSESFLGISRCNSQCSALLVALFTMNVNMCNDEDEYNWKCGYQAGTSFEDEGMFC
jgi:hypothetical protein